MSLEHKPLPAFGAWDGPRKPRLVILGEAWGQSEHELRRPFVGESGKELFQMLGEAFPEVEPELHSEITRLYRYGSAWVKTRNRWLEAASIAFTNVLNFRPLASKISEACCSKKELPPGQSHWPEIERSPKSLFLRPEFYCELDRLAEELREAKPNLVLAMGAKASWALTYSTKISSIRGAITQSVITPAAGGMPAVKVLPTYHPSNVLRQWNWRPIVVADLMKARVEMAFPELIRPSRQILYSPTIEEVENWTDRVLAAQPLQLACDTETSGGQMTMISFAPEPDFALVIPFIDKASPGWSYWATAELENRAWRCVARLLESPAKKVWQNGLYDLQYLLPLGFRVSCDSDPMLLHHSRLPEMKKGLGFLGSIYGREPAWKLMRTEKMDTEKRDE